MNGNWVETLGTETRQYQFAKKGPHLRICTKKTAHDNSDCFKYQ